MEQHAPFRKLGNSRGQLPLGIAGTGPVVGPPALINVPESPGAGAGVLGAGEGVLGAGEDVLGGIVGVLGGVEGVLGVPGSGLVLGGGPVSHCSRVML